VVHHGRFFKNGCKYIILMEARNLAMFPNLTVVEQFMGATNSFLITIFQLKI